MEIRRKLTFALETVKSFHSKGIAHGKITPNIINTDREGTESSQLWYRAPEVLVEGVADVLDCTSDSPTLPAVDMWALGCNFAEWATGSPLFGSAETSFDLLSLHCDWLGFTYTSPDGNLEIRSPNYPNYPKIEELVPGLCCHGYDLLSRLLHCDYNSRISAEDALNHQFLKCTCDLTAYHDVKFCEVWDARTPVLERDIEGGGREADDFRGLYQPYPSFLDCPGHDGSHGCIPSSILALVEKRRRKRERAEAMAMASAVRQRTDTAPSV